VGAVSLFTLLSSLPTLAHSLPPLYAQASRSVHCPLLTLSSRSLQNINDITKGVRISLHFPPTTTSSVLPAPFDALPPPLSSCLQRQGIVQAMLQIVVLLSNSNQHWLCCHHEVATLVDLHFFVPLVCHAWAIFLVGNGARPTEEELMMAVFCLTLVFVEKY
jgi:hypothetical protein